MASSSCTLRRWIETSETSTSALTRINTIIKPFITLPPPLHRLPLRAGNVLEIVGPTPSAKSHLLMQVAVECVSPKEYGGMEGSVMFVDLDCRFDILRFAQLLRYRLSVQSQSSAGEKQCEEDKELFESCMKRFLYTRCYNSFEFLVTLKTFNHQLQKEKHTLEVGPHLFMIDSIGAFYWMDRGLPSSPLGANNRKTLTLQTTSEIAVQEMQRLLLVHPMIVLITKTASLGQMNTTRKQNKWSSAEVIPYREYMPSIWQTCVTHRILLQQTSDDNKELENKLLYLAQWLLPSLNMVDKFVVSDGGVFLA